MTEGKRVFSLIMTMALICMVVVGITILLLYRTSYEQQRSRLAVSAQSQARLAEAVARFRPVSVQNDAEQWEKDCVDILLDAHQHYRGFGKTGEFTLATRKGDQVDFLLSSRHPELTGLKPIPFDSPMAEPMRLALSGISGTMEGVDYRGVTVLAAHEPVAGLNLGIVTKIDLSEIRAPFIKAALAALCAAVLAIAAGALSFVRITRPMIDGLRDKSRKLEAMVDALRESESRFRLLYENAPLGYQSLDDKGRFLEVNQAWVDTLGYSKEEVTGRWFGGFLHPDSVDSFKENFEKFKADGVTRGTVFEMIRKDGSSVAVSFHGKVGRDEAGRFRKTHCILHNITEQRRIEEAVRASELRFRLIAETSTDIIYHLDTAGTFVYCSPAVETALGYTPEQVTGKELMQFVPDTGQPSTRQAFERAVSEKRIEFLELELMKEDGTRVSVETTMVPMVRGERVTGIQGIARDITGRKLAEEERARLAKAVEHSAESIMIADRQGTIQYVNPAFERITGYGREEAIGRNPAFLKSGKHDEAFYRELWDTVSHGRVWTGHLIDKKKDGTFLEEEASISPVLDAGGAITDYVAVKRDVTHEVRLEKTIRQTQKMEAIGTLAGGIAHDFNNILSAILGYTEISLDYADKGNALYDNLQEVLKATKRAGDLVRQILTFSRETEQELRPVQVRRIVREALKLLRASLPATIQIRQDLHSESAVLAEPSQIHQIIMNLCTNSAHAMGERGGVLEVRLTDETLSSEFTDIHPELRPGAHIRLSVIDTGHGIEPALLERIFDPFFTTKKRGEGTGMGLSVVHGIVSSGGGIITVYSKPGQGTAFNVYLPVIRDETPQEEEIETPIPFGHERILFVDDEQPIAALGKQMLENLGYEVVTRTHSVEALELFRAKPNAFDLVITDMTMPDMTGKELAEHIMHIRDVPIILCTGFSARINEEQAKAMGIRAFVMKPLLKRQLGETIRDVLEERSAR